MKNLKNAKGITLVALVVTIIVLLILAGVSLSLVAGGDGIINRASNASNQNKIAAIEEAVELEVAQDVTKYYEAKYTGTKNVATTTTALDYIAKLANADATISHKLSHATYGDIRIAYLAAGTDTYKATFAESDKLEVSTANGTQPDGILMVSFKDGDRYGRVWATITKDGEVSGWSPYVNTLITADPKGNVSVADSLASLVP